MRLEDKQKAIALRKSGRSYREIMVLIPRLPKSTLNNWVKDIELTEKQKRIIMLRAKTKVDQARLRGAWTNREKRITRINQIQQSAKEEFELLLKNPLFLPGLMLYLAEGSQKQERAEFMNSSPALIVFMSRWFIEICGVNPAALRFRLYTHRVYAEENHEKFWQALFKTASPATWQKTVYKPTPHTTKKNPAYRGCLRIYAGGTGVFFRIKGWEKAMILHFQLLSPW